MYPQGAGTRPNGGEALREHRVQAAVLLGHCVGGRPLEDGEGEQRERGILLDKSIHRGVERAAWAARRRVLHTGRRGQRRRNPACQGAPEPRPCSPCLGPRSRQKRGFNMGVVGAIYHRYHHTPPCPSMFSRRSGSCRVWSPPVRRSGWRRGGAGLRLHPRISEEVSFFISQKPNYCCHDEQKKV
jgi:hypothetical protein